MLEARKLCKTRGLRLDFGRDGREGTGRVRARVEVTIIQYRNRYPGIKQGCVMSARQLSEVTIQKVRRNRGDQIFAGISTTEIQVAMPGCEHCLL